MTVTAGQLLREAREASGLHIAALAVALKVPVNKLEALEADNYAALPDIVFVRALASSVCRTLKVDPGPILSLLPQSQSPRLSADSAGLNAPVKPSAAKSSSSASFSSNSNTWSRSVSLVVLVLLVGALAVFFFPRQPGGLSLLSSGSTTQPEPGAGEPVSASPPAPPNSVVETVPVNPAAAPTDRSATAATPATVRPAASAPEATVGQAMAPAPAAAASEPASAAAAAAGTLVLRARSQSWVQVKDAAGAVVLQRNLAADESVSVSAPAPLAVVIGRADATEVFVRGKPFDLTGVSRENVARFEVK
ncbi:helix-turn-helix domain-containing protein [Acidovorax sp. LjRoot194]|uniref:helix-turn-helix domain-containing protein n=1 Tax=Acidovorax sp. LjRoot194 TaxID=3342280 RepID=UPI003F501860